MQLLCVRPTRNLEVTGCVPTTTARRNLTGPSSMQIDGQEGPP